MLDIPSGFLTVASPDEVISFSDIFLVKISTRENTENTLCSKLWEGSLASRDFQSEGFLGCCQMNTEILTGTNITITRLLCYVKAVSEGPGRKAIKRPENVQRRRSLRKFKMIFRNLQHFLSLGMPRC